MKIYLLMSPASIVHQITDRQGTEIKKQIPNLSEGLGKWEINLSK